MATSNSAPPRPATNFSRATFALASDCERVCRERLRPGDRFVLRRIRTISCLRAGTRKLTEVIGCTDIQVIECFAAASRESQLPIVPHPGRGSRAILLAVKLSSFVFRPSSESRFKTSRVRVRDSRVRESTKFCSSTLRCSLRDCG